MRVGTRVSSRPAPSMGNQGGGCLRNAGFPNSRLPCGAPGGSTCPSRKRCVFRARPRASRDPGPAPPGASLLALRSPPRATRMPPRDVPSLGPAASSPGSPLLSFRAQRGPWAWTDSWVCPPRPQRADPAGNTEPRPSARGLCPH